MSSISTELSDCQSMLDDGRAEEALGRLNSLCGDHPDSALAHFLRGRAHHKLDQWHQAIDDYRRAIALDDRLESAWWFLITLLQYSQPPAEMVALCRACLERFPGNIHIANYLGMLLARQEDWDGALGSFESALAQDGSSSYSHFGRVLSLLAAGRYDQAVEAMELGKSRRPRFNAAEAERLNAEGLALAEQGQWPEAAAKFRAAIGAHIEYDDAHFNLGIALRQLGRLTIPVPPPQRPAFRRLRDAYHAMAYFENRLEHRPALVCHWQGQTIQKFPSDMLVYHDILWETRPTLLIECGTFMGGSALYYASQFDMIGAGRVVSVDLGAQPNLPQHPRITYLSGSSTDPAMVEQLKSLAAGEERVMLILDSDHSSAHVAAELAALHGLVTPGCYLVVEDSNIDLSPVANGNYLDGGPLPALADFIGGHPDFYIDRRREGFMTTVAPYGFLLRLPSAE